MRIGIDARPLIGKNMAGISTYLHNILLWLAENDKENEYLLYSWSEFEVERDYGPNFHFRLVKPTRGFLWNVIDIPLALLRDKVKVFWGPTHELPRRVPGVRSVLTVHDLALILNPAWGNAHNAKVMNKHMPKAAKRADQILADSRSTKEDLIRVCGTDGDKISVVYLGGVPDRSDLVSPEALAAAKEKYGIKDKFFYFVGTIEPRKNIETAIRAFNLVAEKDPDVQLILAGGLGWSYGGILQAMELSPYTDRIKHIGYVSLDEKMNLYAASQAFLFPSHYEGFGIPVLEAMRLGSIVITANNSSLPEVGGDAALYVDDENDATALATLMEQVLAMESIERQERIRLGIAQTEKFSWEQCARETAQVLTGKELSV